jgi:hypothetical protein
LQTEDFNVASTSKTWQQQSLKTVSVLSLESAFTSQIFLGSLSAERAFLSRTYFCHALINVDLSKRWSCMLVKLRYIQSTLF